MKLVHISDVHLATVLSSNPFSYIGKRATGFFSWHMRRKNIHLRKIADSIIDDISTIKPDHVAITGDMVNLGLNQEIIKVKTWLSNFETELISKSNNPKLAISDASSLISLVPGNHDHYVWRSGSNAAEQWSKWLIADNNSRIKLLYPLKNNSKNHLNNFRANKVALIGLNSGRATWPFVAKGYLPSKQLDELPEKLEKLKKQGAIRIIMIHHPPKTDLTKSTDSLCSLRHKDALRLQDIIDKHGCELILHGHNHHIEYNLFGAGNNKTPVMGISSASSNSTKHPAAWALYDFSNQNQAIIKWRLWSEKKQIWQWSEQQQTIDFNNQ